MKKTEKKQSKFHVRKGDTVKIIAGDAKGRTGKILSIVTADNKAFVEGINIVSKHTKPSATNPNGGIVKKEAPVHISNLMVVDPSNGEATRISRKADKNGKLERISKKSGGVIKNG